MQAKGSVHDFNLFKNSYTGFSKRIKVQADSGYQGIKKIHENSEIPKKASKLHPLTKEEKVENTFEETEEDSGSSLVGRILQYDTAINYIQEHKIFGRGYRFFQKRKSS